MISKARKKEAFRRKYRNLLLIRAVKIYANGRSVEEKATKFACSKLQRHAP